MRLSRWLMAGLFAIPIALPAPAGAFHEDGLPLMLEFDQEGHGWLSLKMELSPGEKTALDIEGWGAGQPIEIGAYIYGEDDSGPSGFVGRQLAPDSGVFVDAHPAPGFDLHHDGFVENPYKNYLRAGQTVGAGETESRTFKWLLWSAGTDRWRVSIRGNPQGPQGEEGVRIASTLTGADTFVYTSKDLSGAFNAQAWSPPGARAAVDVRKVIEATDVLIAHYFTIPSLPPTSAGSLSVLTPEGEEITCPCYFQKFASDSVRGPGAYTFNLTGAGVSRESEVVLGGLFARLPA